MPVRFWSGTPIPPFIVPTIIAVLRKEMSRTRKVTLRRAGTWGLSQMVMTVGFDPTGESSILSVPATHIVP